MSLRQQLAALREQLDAEDDAWARTVLARAIERVRMLQLAEAGPQVGEPFPDFVVNTPDGRAVSSAELLAAPPLVLALFRGGWCPYCDLTLRAFDRALDAIRAAGASFVAICPEPWHALGAIAEAKQLRFPVLGDPGGRLARLCDLHFEMSDDHVALYERYGIDIAAHHSGGDWMMPVPATFILDRDATVLWRFADADWAVRAEPEAVLAALHALTPSSQPAGA